MTGNNAHSKNTFRMGLPKPNRYVASPRFRSVSSLNGRSWLKADRAHHLSKMSELRTKPKMKELKKADAAYKKMLSILHARSTKKVSKAIVNNKKKCVDDIKEERFLSFSPFDDRFPKFFESYSPFDSRFEQIASDKIYQSFSPFSSSFPNFPYMKYRASKIACRKGFKSFSPFDERFPQFFVSYSPFDTRFPSNKEEEFMTFSPFDSRFPSQMSSLKKSQIGKSANQTVLTLSSSSKATEAFPRFSPKARNNTVAAKKEKSASPTNVSPLSKVLKNGGYNTMTNRFGL